MAELETVICRWSTEHGICYDCGNPAAYSIINPFAADNPVDETRLRCSICAAYSSIVEVKTISYVELIQLSLDAGGTPRSSRTTRRTSRTSWPSSTQRKELRIDINSWP